MEGYARAEVARTFCDTFGSNRTAYFDSEKYGSMAEAKTLCRFWITRLSLFTDTFEDIFEEYGEVGVQGLEDVFEEDDDVAELYRNGNAACKRRIEQLRRRFEPPAMESAEDEGAQYSKAQRRQLIQRALKARSIPTLIAQAGPATKAS